MLIEAIILESLKQFRHEVCVRKYARHMIHSRATTSAAALRHFLPGQRLDFFPCVAARCKQPASCHRRESEFMLGVHIFIAQQRWEQQEAAGRTLGRISLRSASVEQFIHLPTSARLHSCVTYCRRCPNEILVMGTRAFVRLAKAGCRHRTLRCI